MKKPLSRIDREDTTPIYFAADTEADLGPLEISWDDGITYTPMPLDEDEDGDAAYTATICGPSANNPSGKALALGRNRGIVRYVDNPKVGTKRFSIDVA